MNRAEIINKLKAAEPQLRAHGIAGLYLFGSYARDEAQPESDVDVFIDKAQAEGSVSTSLWAAILPSKMLFPASKSASERARDSINPSRRWSRSKLCAFLMASKNPLIRLGHIRTEIQSITPRLIGVDRQTFIHDYLLLRAGERALLIISEGCQIFANAIDRPLSGG